MSLPTNPELPAYIRRARDERIKKLERVRALLSRLVNQLAGGESPHSALTKEEDALLWASSYMDRLYHEASEGTPYPFKEEGTP